MNYISLKDHIKRFVELHDTQKEAAKELKISPQHLSDILQGRRMPGEDVLKILGLKRVISYVKL